MAAASALPDSAVKTMAAASALPDSAVKLRASGKNEGHKSNMSYEPSTTVTAFSGLFLVRQQGSEGAAC